MHTNMHGRPDIVSGYVEEMRPYLNFREQITIENGLLLKQAHIIV